MGKGKYKFTNKQGFCPECLAFGRCWYIQDRFIGGSAYEYCLMSKTVEKPISYVFQNKNEIAAWLNGAEDNTEYSDDVADYIISCYSDWKSDFSDKALIIQQDKHYIYDKKKNTLTVVTDAKQETGWFDSYRECLKVAKEILSSIEMKEISMKINFPLLIANELKEHCATWNYPWLERLKENTTSESFYKFFCKITRTYYVNDSTDYYHVEFFKDGTVTVKKMWF